MSVLSLLLGLCLVCLCRGREGNSRFHSAKCVALGRRCTAYLERQSGSCKAGVGARVQSQGCYDLACAWCRVPGKLGVFPCSRGILRRKCRVKRKKGGQKKKKKKVEEAEASPLAAVEDSPLPAEEPAESPEEEKAGPEGCVYDGVDKVVISLGGVVARDGWTRVTRAGMRGLVFEKERGGGTVGGGTRGVYCFDVRMEVEGEYYVTAISAAPDKTEHNDCWLKSSVGFRLLRQGVFDDSTGKDEWLKGYQNKGGLEINNVISTKDHNAHAFIVPGVKKGVAVGICMSGRSFQFEMYKLVLVRCSETEVCSPRNMTPRLGSLSGTECK